MRIYKVLKILLVLFTGPKTLSTLYKMKRTVREQVLTVILTRRQHMPGCSFHKGVQEKSEWRTKLSLPSSPLLFSPLLSVIFCHYSVRLVCDPERVSQSSTGCKMIFSSRRTFGPAVYLHWLLGNFYYSLGFIHLYLFSRVYVTGMECLSHQCSLWSNVALFIYVWIWQN